MRELLTVEQYLDELLRLVEPDAGIEHLALADAFGRVLAEPVHATVDIPVFDNSAMDGYAVRFAEVAAVPVSLRVVGDVPAGSASDPTAGPGECVRIMTGAPLPSFADTVVPVEDTDGDPILVTIQRVPAKLAAHVRRAGEDFAAGAQLAEAGAELRVGLVGALAAAGVRQVPVRPRPVVALCATGDELVVDGSALRRGQIHESNSLALSAALSRDGAQVLRAESVGDRPVALTEWLDGATAACDMVVLTGGASVGAFDVVRDVLEATGGTFRHVRMQPGKPQGWAIWTDGTPVVALPGNPLSASLSYEVFVRPLLDRRLGRAARPAFTAVADADWSSPAGRRQLVPVRLSTSSDGRLLARPAHVRGSASHMVTSLAGADGIAVVAEDVTVVAVGNVLTVRWL
ncbi:MAG TPA: molybdopterin molybdotransferase MoeA [Propionicimonas sp.]|nr:molybdopterin molybdotransferase MoeA [Propionicimonas sp.]HRA07108.1 molybdopterin molybdotransferase MoeA [Propionicimonas sp.]